MSDETISHPPGAQSIQMCCRRGDSIQSSAFQSNGRDYGGFRVSYYLSGFGEISMAMLGMCAQVSWNKNVSASAEELSNSRLDCSHHAIIKSVAAAVTAGDRGLLQIQRVTAS